ncbi:MAG: DUF47 family protein [Planctomycetota bacterium]|nr:DUF47 family protein [Planctomycetota bacterium]
MFNIKRRKDEFFGMFDKAAQNVHEAALALLDLLEHYEDVPNKVRRIKNLEHAGDDHTHRMLDRLARMFITPLDRDDIQRAASRLDDVLDEMDTAANRMMLFKIERPTEDSKALGRVLVKATALLIEAFGQLHELRKPEAMQSLCVEVHTQENEGDRLTQHAMANLFEQATDPRDIIKWKDVYEILEKAIDRCEDVADVLQNIVVKHS